jgi:hypothetical protein
MAMKTAATSIADRRAEVRHALEKQREEFIAHRMQARADHNAYPLHPMSIAAQLLRMWISTRGNKANASAQTTKLLILVRALRTLVQFASRKRSRQTNTTSTQAH